jgi:hypothetical protein
MSLQNFDMDDVEKEMAKESGGKGITDFDCPGCNANNPADPPLADGSEILCHYCGCEYRVSMSEGRIKFKEI